MFEQSLLYEKEAKNGQIWSWFKVMKLKQDKPKEDRNEHDD